MGKSTFHPLGVDTNQFLLLPSFLLCYFFSFFFAYFLNLIFLNTTIATAHTLGHIFFSAPIYAFYQFPLWDQFLKIFANFIHFAFRPFKFPAYWWWWWCCESVGWYELKEFRNDGKKLKKMTSKNFWAHFKPLLFNRKISFHSICRNFHKNDILKFTWASK